MIKRLRSFCSCSLILQIHLVLSSSIVAQERENLGPSINTKHDELLPVISADGKTLFFDRRGDSTNIGSTDDDIWFSEMQKDGAWSKAQNIGEPLNNQYYNYVCSALPDNNVLLLGNRYYTNGTMDAGVSLTSRRRDRWAFPSNLNIRNFRNLAHNSEYSMSPDGNVMIMSINPVDSLAGRDLYVSFKMTGTTWSEPQNIGTLSTPESDEITPFIAADANTIYFSSNRPGGYGDYDIYMSRRLDDSWMFWSKPENPGSTINTSGWDAYYTVPASGEYAYFVSTSRGYGGNDIYRILLPDRVKPIPTVIVKGKVSDPLSNPLDAVIRYERLSDGKELGAAQSNELSGEYSIALPAGVKYGIRAEKEGYLPVNENIDLTEATTYPEVRRDLTLVPIEKGKTVRMNNIFFEFDKAALTSESTAELDRLVSFLQSRSDIRIEISGHTDNVGADEYNLRLSELRAQSVVDYLISKAVASGRLVAKGYGKTKPVESNATEEGRQKNRRVEFTIL